MLYNTTYETITASYFFFSKWALQNQPANNKS